MYQVQMENSRLLERSLRKMGPVMVIQMVLLAMSMVKSLLSGGMTLEFFTQWKPLYLTTALPARLSLMGLMPMPATRHSI